MASLRQLLTVVLVAATCVSVHGFSPAGLGGPLAIGLRRAHSLRQHGGRASPNGLRVPLRIPRYGAVDEAVKGRMWRMMTAMSWQDSSDVHENLISGEPAAESAGQYGLGLVPVQTYWEQADRIVAIGDVHGDEGALIACLRMSKCIDTDGNWCGGKTHVVQIGDILDRGDEERGCLDLLFQLKPQAAAAGGAVHILMGNHEAMNMDWDFDYVGLGGFDGWKSRSELHTEATSFFGNVLASVTDGWKRGGVPRVLKERAQAFTVGTGFAALYLSEMPMVIQLGDTVCVHGGLELKHLDMDLHQINVATNEWLRGISERPYLIDHEDSPIWNRSFSAPGDRPITEKNARKLEQVLSAMGARRMIVGHTPQIGGINSFVTELGYEVWRTDTGMSRWVKNGPVECLEILADGTSRVLTTTGVVPGAVRRMEENAEPVTQKRANSGGGERGYNKGAAPV